MLYTICILYSSIYCSKYTVVNMNYTSNRNIINKSLLI